MINTKNIINSLFIIIIILSSSCSDSPTQPNENELKEIFPLAIGYTYLYSYNYVYTEFIRANYIVDSGTVKYTIIDSTRISDNVNLWEVEELSEYYRRRPKVANSPNPIDTTYLIVSRKNLILKEQLDNYHELECKSLAWSFPIVDSSYIGSGYQITRYISIPRYSDQESLRIEQTGSTGYFPTDTLFFSENRGLIYYRRDNAIEVMGGYREWKILELLELTK